MVELIESNKYYLSRLTPLVAGALTYRHSIDAPNSTLELAAQQRLEYTRLSVGSFVEDVKSLFRWELKYHIEQYPLQLI
jgi:hypothetical protein